MRVYNVSDEIGFRRCDRLGYDRVALHHHLYPMMRRSGDHI